jgi:hypothetical protein
MAQIERPVLPTRLYRYRSLTRDENSLHEEIDAIRENYLWCSDFTRMNDPMEGFYRPSSRLKDKGNYNRILKQITSMKTNVGMACFSDTKENVLMWTHYAGNHTGICLAYSTRRLIDGLPSYVSLVRLAYGDDPPLLSTGDARNAETAARKILSQKKYNWAYEREWRVLGPKGRVDIGSENAVTDLYFGARIDLKHRQKMLSKLQGTGIKAHIMQVDGYEHTWVPANAAAKSRRSE